MAGRLRYRPGWPKGTKTYGIGESGDLTAPGNRWALVGILCLSNIAVGTLGTGITPFLPRIIEEYDISYTSAGLLVSAFYLAFAVTQVPVGIIADRIHPGRMVASAVTIMTVGGILFSFMQSFPLMLLARILMGLGAGSVYVPGIKLIASWFSEGERGIPVSGISSSSQIGIVTSNLVGPAVFLLTGGEWRMVQTFFSLIFIVVAILGWTMVARSASVVRRDTVAEVGALSQIAEVSKKWTGWLLMSNTFIIFGGVFGIVSWVPTALAGGPGGLTAASHVAGTIPLGIIPGFFLAGWLSNRLHDRRLAQKLAVAGFTAAILIFTYTMTVSPGDYVALAGAAFAMGFLTLGSLFVVSMLFSMYPVSQVGTVMGVMNGMAFAGTFFYPLALGFIYDLAQSFAPSMLFVALTQILAIGLTIPIRKRV